MSTVAPAPFIAAMVVQESGGRQFCVPTGDDEDNFVVVGLDRGDPGASDHITSRGYGIGQYTIFHHPPRAEEVADFIVDPARNVQHAFAELRAKFDRFVVGPDGRADDRTAEHPLLTLRACKYAPSDARYMRDCRACAAAAGTVEIQRGTPAWPGASFGYQPDQVLSLRRLSWRAGPRRIRLRLAIRGAPLQRQRQRFLPLPDAHPAEPAGRTGAERRVMPCHSVSSSMSRSAWR